MNYFPAWLFSNSYLPTPTNPTSPESYVAELMKHKAGAGQAAPPPPRIGKFRSADVSAPYVLACHHTDSNSKIVRTEALRA
jgi:hypothetical protein